MNMAYSVVIAVPFDDWSPEDERIIKGELSRYRIDSTIISPLKTRQRSMHNVIQDSDLVMILYPEYAFNSELISTVISVASNCDKKIIIIKEIGVPLRGLITNVDVIEYDPERPEHTVSLLISLARKAKERRDAKIGAAAAGTVVGLGLAAGLAYLLYRMMR
jgi:hypothetical protein